MAKQRHSADEIEAIARNAMQTALGSPESDIGQARERNLRYYNAEAKGDLAPPEIEDRSDFVATDVADTVEGMLPEFMDMFIAGDAVDITAKRFEDEQSAKLVKAWINHLFMNKMDGVEITHDWFKDSLIQKVGFIKVWAEEESSDLKQRYEGQSEEALVMLLQDGWELVGEVEQDDDGLSFVVDRLEKKKCIRVCVIPPNEMRVDSNSRWDADPAMIGQCFYKRRFELEQEGFVVEDVSSYANNTDGETLEMLGEVNDSLGSAPHKSHDLIKIEEVYIKLDQDMDGAAEWVKVCLIDSKLAVYEDGSDAWEQVDDHPYVWVCPIPRPHSFYGDCPADFAIQPQKLRTATIRAIQDNMYLTVNQRQYVDMDRDVNIQDVLENRPGGMIRGRGPNGVTPIVQPNLGAPAYQFNEFLEQWKENRTGYTRFSAGLDAGSLNNTATGISIVTQRSQLRMKLMGRFLAVGYSKLMKKLLKLSVTYLNQDEMVKINGEYIPLNPSHLGTDYGFKIAVGLGTGTKEQQAGRVMGLLQVMQGGAQMGVVKPENMAEAIKLYAEINEFKQPERFVSAPDGQPSPEQIAQGQQALQMQQQQIQEMGGEMQKLAQENEQLKAQMQNKQAETMLKAQGGEVDAQFKAQELALKERELALKEQQAQFDAEMKQREMMFKQHECDKNSETAEYQAKTDRATALGVESLPEVIEASAMTQMAQAIAELVQQMGAPKTKVGRMVKLPDGSYQMEQREA